MGLFDIIAMSLENIVHKIKMPFVVVGASAYMLLNLLGCNSQATPTPTINPTNTPAPTRTFTPKPTITPNATLTPTPKPEPNNSYDFAKSLGLEAIYLKDVAFDSNSRAFISYLSSLPLQMRNIAESSGLVKKLDNKQSASGVVDDRQITLDEVEYFKRAMESYKKEIETMQPWLKQLPENEVTAALALNLRNFREAGSSMFYNLDIDTMPLLLPQALFTADGMVRKYEEEIVNPEGFLTGRINPYAAAAVKNITNFSGIQKKAWEVANDPNYRSTNGQSVEEILHAGYFQAEAVGSTDKGRNAYEDIKLLLEQGSFEAKATLRLYARNLREGKKGSAEQVRVELTEIDLWSLGLSSYTVVLEGHDVPTIPLTLDDIKLLKSRSSDPLLILDINGSKHLPFQWTRTNIIRPDVTYFTIPDGIARKEIKVSELKNY